MTVDTMQTVAITTVITGILGYVGNAINNALKKINDIEDLKAKLDANNAQHNKDIDRIEKELHQLQAQVYELNKKK